MSKPRICKYQSKENEFTNRGLAKAITPRPAKSVNRRLKPVVYNEEYGLIKYREVGYFAKHGKTIDFHIIELELGAKTDILKAIFV